MLNRMKVVHCAAASGAGSSDFQRYLGPLGVDTVHIHSVVEMHACLPLMKPKGGATFLPPVTMTLMDAYGGKVQRTLDLTSVSGVIIDLLVPLMPTPPTPSQDLPALVVASGLALAVAVKAAGFPVVVESNSLDHIIEHGRMQQNLREQLRALRTHAVAVCNGLNVQLLQLFCSEESARAAIAALAAQ